MQNNFLISGITALAVSAFPYPAFAAGCPVSGYQFIKFAEQLGSQVATKKQSKSGNCYVRNNSLIASATEDAAVSCIFTVFNGVQMAQRTSFEKFLYSGQGYTIMQGPARGSRSLKLRLKVDAPASTSNSVSITRVVLNVEVCKAWKDAF